MRRDAWEALDNLGHVVKLPRSLQGPLCDRVDSFYTDNNPEVIVNAP